MTEKSSLLGFMQLVYKSVQHVYERLKGREKREGAATFLSE